MWLHMPPPCPSEIPVCSTRALTPFFSRELRERRTASSGDIPPGAALVGTLRCFGGVLDRIQLPLESVEAGRSTLVELCTEVTQAVDRLEIADQWSAEVYATTREWPPSDGGDIPYRELSL